MTPRLARDSLMRSPATRHDKRNARPYDRGTDFDENRDTPLYHHTLADRSITAPRPVREEPWQGVSRAWLSKRSAHGKENRGHNERPKFYEGRKDDDDTNHVRHRNPRGRAARNEYTPDRVTAGMGGCAPATPREGEGFNPLP